MKTATQLRKTLKLEVKIRLSREILTMLWSAQKKTTFQKKGGFLSVQDCGISE
jgi:hypothetical protein